jgi:putative DNA primase/helicase
MRKSFAPHDYVEEIAQCGTYASDNGAVYRWTGKFWSPARNEIIRDAYRWLVENQREHANDRNAVKALNAAILWFSKMPTSTDEVVLPCQNGYVFVRSGVASLEEPDPELGIRYLLPCHYEPTGSSPDRFLHFIEEILPDETVRARVQEYIGYTLTSDVRYQRAQLWLGTGANGKGVLANIVQALHSRPESVRLDSLDGFGLSSLIDATLIFSDETPNGRVNEQLLKSLIAGERVLVDRKYSDPISVKFRGKWLVLGNNLPALKDHSHGFWRRWDLVPFSVTIPEARRDGRLAETIIKNELSGVLVWALEGLKRLQLRGGFDVDVPGSMSEMLDEARVYTNTVRAWCDESSINHSPSTQMWKDDVYELYKSWCLRNGERAYGSVKFWHELEQIMPVEYSRKRDNNRRHRRTCNLEVA